MAQSVGRSPIVREPLDLLPSAAKNLAWWHTTCPSNTRDHVLRKEAEAGGSEVPRRP